MTARTHHVVDSPIGPLTLVAQDGPLVGLYLHSQRHGPAPEHLGDRDARGFEHATAQLEAYFAGQLTTFDLELAPRGTAFQRTVWSELARIPYGCTASYGELAARIGRPTACRAVGLANGRNPLSIVIPCHRVVGASGALTGYGGGVDRKRYLLKLEAARGPDRDY